MRKSRLKYSLGSLARLYTSSYIVFIDDPRYIGLLVLCSVYLVEYSQYVLNQNSIIDNGTRTLTYIPVIVQVLIYLYLWEKLDYKT